MMAAPGPVLVMGAGAVGCWIGGNLAAAGVPVTFVARPRVLDAMKRHGLILTDLGGGTRKVAGDALDVRSTPEASMAPALVLLCVKSGATADAAAELGHVLPPGTPLVSMQNGLSNAALAHTHAPSLTALAGMVPFNVVELAPGHYHCAIGGTLAIQDHAALHAWLPVFATAGVPFTLHADLASVQWGKLLLNLNNPVNALSGLPLRAQLLQRDYRVCMAALIGEALAALKAAGTTPAKLTPLPPNALPTILRLPTAIFRLLAFRMLRMDATARTSMANDLANGRPTEIDALCGEVVRLARAHGLDAPVNRRITELVLQWPAQRKPLAGAELRRALALG